MSPRIGRSDIPELREFLDNLPKIPCPSKLPEEYCKLCRRLNGEVAHYCETRELPPMPMEQEFEERRELEREGIEEPRIAHRVPILERPRYEEGETSLEFVPSEKSIEEARKSLPRFIPVHRGPRPFRPLEEFGPEEFETFTLERPSIFKHPSLIAEGEEGMMFTLVSDEGAIEVTPLEMDDEGSIPSETVFESPEGVVEVVEIFEGEEETPFFEFVEEGEGEIVEAEIVEAEIVEEGSISEEYLPKEGVEDTLEKGPYEGDVPLSEKIPMAEPVEVPPEEVRPDEEKEIKEIAPEKPKKRPKIKKKLRFKKMKEKKPKKARRAEAKPEAIPEEPKEKELVYEEELKPMEEPKTSEEIKTLAELLGEKLEEQPRGEISEEIPPSEGTEKTLAELLGERPEEVAKPTPSVEAKTCPKCGGEATYIEQYQSNYCYTCSEYIETMEKAMEEKVGPEEIEPEAEKEEQISKEEMKEEISERLQEPEPGEEIIQSEEIESESEVMEERPEEGFKKELPPEAKEKGGEVVEQPSPQEAMVCPKCGGEASYIEQYKMYYCYNCSEYVEPEEKPIEEGLQPEPSEEIPPSEEIRFQPEIEGEEIPRKKGKKKKKKFRMKKIKLKRPAKQEDEKEVTGDNEEMEG